MTKGKRKIKLKCKQPTFRLKSPYKTENRKEERKIKDK